MPRRPTSVERFSAGDFDATRSFADSADGRATTLPSLPGDVAIAVELPLHWPCRLCHRRPGLHRRREHRRHREAAHVHVPLGHMLTRLAWGKPPHRRHLCWPWLELAVCVQTGAPTKTKMRPNLNAFLGHFWHFSRKNLEGKYRKNGIFQGFSKIFSAPKFVFTKMVFLDRTKRQTINRIYLWRPARHLGITAATWGTRWRSPRCSSWGSTKCTRVLP